MVLLHMTLPFESNLAHLKTVMDWDYFIDTDRTTGTIFIGWKTNVERSNGFVQYSQKVQTSDKPFEVGTKDTWKDLSSLWSPKSETDS